MWSGFVFFFFSFDVSKYVSKLINHISFQFSTWEVSKLSRVLYSSMFTLTSWRIITIKKHMVKEQLLIITKRWSWKTYILAKGHALEISCLIYNNREAKSKDIDPIFVNKQTSSFLSSEGSFQLYCLKHQFQIRAFIHKSNKLSLP